MTTPLGGLIREIVAADGPIGLDRYMALALNHPTLGYYATRDPFGVRGDFTTAPEVSQIFGELIGLWAAATWDAAGRPSPFGFCELGPGRGTLMADALRATARALPAFNAAAAIHLVEQSPTLRAVQADTLRGLAAARWHGAAAGLPPGPAILIGNEFLDALPIRQFVRADRGWHERVVGLDAGGHLAWGLRADPEPALTAVAPPGAVIEMNEAAVSVAGDLARRFRRDGGAVLFLDYGHGRSGIGDTLQAVRGHAFADPLAAPGEADLTAHVDFGAIARAAAAAGASVCGPIEQGAFLDALGIGERAARLSAGADPPARAAIAAATNRLRGTGSAEMGRLFKAIGIAAPHWTPLPGLPPPGPAGHPTDHAA